MGSPMPSNSQPVTDPIVLEAICDEFREKIAQATERQALIILIPSIAIAVAFFRRSSPTLLAAFIVWNGLGAAFWYVYSTYHLARWQAEGAGNLLLLIPELLLLLYAVALIAGMLHVFVSRFSQRRSRSRDLAE